MVTNTKKLINSLKSRPEIKTPIGTDLFLPNHSGISSHPEIKDIYVKKSGDIITGQLKIHNDDDTFNFLVGNSNGSYYDFVVSSKNHEVTISDSTDFICEGDSVFEEPSIFNNKVTIDSDSSEAFLIRKDGDSGDVFLVDTNNGRVGINSNTVVGVTLAINFEDKKGAIATSGVGMMEGSGGTVQSPLAICHNINPSYEVEPSTASATTIGGIQGSVSLFSGDGGSPVYVTGTTAQARLVNFGNTWTSGKTHQLVGGVFGTNVFNYFGTIQSNINLIGGWFNADGKGRVTGTEKALGWVSSDDVMVSSDKKLYFEGSYTGTVLTIGDTYQIYNSSASELQTVVNGTEIMALKSNAIGFYNTTPVTKQTISGSKGGNAALGNLLTALANLGLIVDSTT